jgi:hypothetical protein
MLGPTIYLINYIFQYGSLTQYIFHPDITNQNKVWQVVINPNMDGWLEARCSKCRVKKLSQELVGTWKGVKSGVWVFKVNVNKNLRKCYCLLTCYNL